MVTSFKKDPVSLEDMKGSFSSAVHNAIWADINSELNGSEFRKIQIEGQLSFDEIINKMNVEITPEEIHAKIKVLLDYALKNTFRNASDYTYERVLLHIIDNDTIGYSLMIYSKRPRVALEGYNHE